MYLKKKEASHYKDFLKEKLPIELIITEPNFKKKDKLQTTE